MKTFLFFFMIAGCYARASAQNDLAKYLDQQLQIELDSISNYHGGGQIVLRGEATFDISFSDTLVELRRQIFTKEIHSTEAIVYHINRKKELFSYSDDQNVSDFEGSTSNHFQLSYSTPDGNHNFKDVVIREYLSKSGDDYAGLVPDIKKDTLTYKSSSIVTGRQMFHLPALSK